LSFHLDEHHRLNPSLHSHLTAEMIADRRPTVSIVTPSYNQGQYIQRTIDSVLSQDYPKLDYLIMDGSSVDGTLQLLEKLAAAHPKRLRYVCEKDRGQSHALNKAISQTTGKIIGWLNSDDTFHPGAVSAAVEYFERHPDVDLVYGNANFTDPHDRFIARCAHVEPYDWERLVHYTDFIVQPAAFFTRRAFEAVGGADESLCYAMDYDLFLKIAAKFKVAHLPDVLASYRWSGENKTAVGEWARLREIEKVTAAFGAKGLPAYTRIEAAFLGLRLAIRDACHGRIAKTAHHLAAGAKAVVASPRSWRSLASPACWKVMWTGQILRRRERQLRKSP
jgi:glycosyltransferase involved in cell wall biosynthesis